MTPDGRAIEEQIAVESVARREVWRNGGPAFPRPSYEGQGRPLQSGMSLRDWFAGMALIALAQEAYVGQAKTADGVAGEAYALADAMLREGSE